ncbi:putative fatty-acid--CoA ligase [Gordonia effusa NBRC 100432]|uniref:Putative fatty-acid--CoA ligase n=1 Tax=Gordonia effusa NBRC 100432 TaxID=1077974 RepID=H0R174_9ACTN|nr:AMP-binding protein [Gordonia effusa]GAB18825.1 putative fatty-acid--CoA ligase [Gordonia effusa NBRC 100432]
MTDATANSSIANPFATHSVGMANRSELTPLRFLERSAEVFGDKTAIVYGRREYTYAEFADEAARLATVLAADIAPGDRIAVLAPNIPEMLIAHFAVPLARGVLVALNSRLAGPELAYILNHAEVTTLLFDAEFGDTVAQIVDHVPSLATTVEIIDDQFGSDRTAPTVPGVVGYDEFLTRADDLDSTRLPWTVDDENQIIAINYTSGTTGKPKGVMYTHRGAYLNSFGETFHNQFTGSTRYLWTLPMFHCNGWCTPWAVTHAAGTHVCLRAVRADAVWDAIDHLGVTHLCGAPTVCTTIVGADQAHALDRPLHITTAGAPPSPTVIGKLEAIGVTVVHVYGLTEVYGPYTICEYQSAWDELPPDDRAARLSRQGVGMVQAESARVVERDRIPLVDVAADGTAMGEIVLRGNNVMAGYFKNPDATAEAFAGGWFHTGDLGVMHPDGYIQLRDRAKDIIISGGENISTVEVEQALVSHDQVVDVAVVGVPDDKWGERPRAYVQLGAGASLAADDLIAHARKLLAGYKVPRDIVFVGELPRTSTGKVLKFELRQRAAEN